MNISLGITLGKEHIFMLFCVFFSFVCRSQKLAIRDSISNEPIPFAKVIIDDKICYADSNGAFVLDKYPQNRMLEFGAYGYNVKRIAITKSEIVFLTPKYREMEEVNILRKNLITLDRGKKKNKTTQLSEGVEITCFISNNQKVPCLIEDLKFFIKSFKEDSYFIVLNFYSKDGDGINSKPFNSRPIILSLKQFRDNNYTFKISDDKIVLPTEGAYIGLRVTSSVGYYKTGSISTPIILFYGSDSKSTMYFRVRNEQKWTSFGGSLVELSYSLRAKF